jgi:hypothetical protein
MRVSLSMQHDFKPSMIVRDKADCSLPRKSGNGFRSDDCFCLCIDSAL